MSTKSLKSHRTVLAIGIVLAVFAAPAVHAQPRDAGMGRIIAAQGNQALQLMKAELKATIKALAPTLPSRPAAKPASQPGALARALPGRLAPVNGAAAAVRCAE